MELLYGALITAILGSSGFLLKRWITGERKKERVVELSTLTSVVSQMRAGGVSVEEIEALKRYLDHGQRVDTAPLSFLRQPDAPTTQLEINEAAAGELRKLDREMRDIIEEISSYLTLDELSELTNAQSKWKDFSQAHAQFVSKLFEGGSMQPLWFITTIDIATKNRLDELKSYLDVRRSG